PLLGRGAPQPRHSPRLAGGREPHARDASDPDGLGAEGDRLDDVRAADEPSVDPDAGAAPDRPNDLGQHGEASSAVVELAASVVGDVDDLDSVLARDVRVLTGGDALEDERHVRVDVLEALDLVPREAALVFEAGRRRPP